MKSLWRQTFAAALAIGLALPAAEAQTVKLRYGVIAASAKNVQSVPLYIAQRKGFFAREGVEFDIVPLPGVHHMIAELDKNNVQLSFTAVPSLVEAVLKGSEAVGVIGGPANTAYSIIVKPEIRTFADLKGKAVAVSLPVDTISIATRMLLAKHGINEGDFVPKQHVGTPVRAKCLESGECDAAPLAQPEDFNFLKKGYRKLGDSLEVIPHLQFSVIAARRAWAKENADSIMRFARAYGAAYRFMADPANRDEVVNIMTQTTGTDAAMAREVLKFYYEPDRGIMPKQAEISMPGMAMVIELLGKSGALPAPLPPADRFVDLQYLRGAKLQP